MRQRILDTTRRKLAPQADSYPALNAALRAVEASFENTPMGYQVEREEFTKLLNTDTSRHLLGLFFARENARKLSTWTREPSVVVHNNPIRHVGVIGAGAMGAGIAQLAAVRDFDVTIKEISPQLLNDGHRRVETLMKKVASRQAWPESRLSQTLGRIRYTTRPKRYGVMRFNHRSRRGANGHQVKSLCGDGRGHSRAGHFGYQYFLVVSHRDEPRRPSIPKNVAGTALSSILSTEWNWSKWFDVIRPMSPPFRDWLLS